MTSDKGAVEPEIVHGKNTQTPFERLADFVRRIIVVPKSEMDKKAREYGKKRKQAHK